MIKAYAAKEVGAKLEAFEYEESKLGRKDVDIEISHCGICHSDVHLVDNDWGLSTYPLVPGHEIIGTVKAVGDEVTHLKAGMRVGVGWQRDSCGICDYCIKGDENLCASQQATCMGHHGGFADRIILNSDFAFQIPEGMSSENAAPLLCGGITVYSPLRHYGVNSTMKVGVIGIGGLGHLALQFAKALGCEVTAFSSNPSKEEEARKLGADHFVSSTDPAKLEAASQDFILSTAHASLNWDAYVNALKPDGKLCLVGVPNDKLSVEVFPLLAGRRSICGSPIGGRYRIREMLEFAHRHNIEAQTQSYGFDQINEALDHVRTNKARYRAVLHR